jgi:hypothetical protein
MASCSNERPTLLVAVGRIVAGHGASRVRRRRADRTKQRVQKVPFIVADDRQRAPSSASTDSPGRRQSRSRFRVRSISSLLILASMSSIVVERKASWAMASFFFWVRGGPVVSRPRGAGFSASVSAGLRTVNSRVIWFWLTTGHCVQLPDVPEPHRLQERAQASTGPAPSGALSAWA